MLLLILLCCCFCNFMVFRQMFAGQSHFGHSDYMACPPTWHELHVTQSFTKNPTESSHLDTSGSFSPFFSESTVTSERDPSSFSLSCRSVSVWCKSSQKLSKHSTYQYTDRGIYLRMLHKKRFWKTACSSVGLKRVLPLSWAQKRVHCFCGRGQGPPSRSESSIYTAAPVPGCHTPPWRAR